MKSHLFRVCDGLVQPVHQVSHSIPIQRNREETLSQQYLDKIIPHGKQKGIK